MGIDTFLYVEDRLTEAVVMKILRRIDRDFSVCQRYLWNKDIIRKRIKELNRAAKGDSLYSVITDQDTPDNCPASAIENLGAALSSNLLYRFATMEIESWIMADRGNIARFLSIDKSKMPRKPDEVPKPKERMVSMARRSRSKRIREDMVPSPSAKTAKVGRGYHPSLIEFVVDQWDVIEAQGYSPSLERSYRRLQTFRLPEA